MAEIRPIVYSKELQKELYPDNSFYKKSVQEKGVADTTKTVEKPTQGKIRKAKKGDPLSLPLKVEAAKDDSASYAVEVVYCEPLLIDSQSELLVNYNKRKTKQEQQASELNTKCANIAAVNWGPTKTTNILKTTGEGRVSNIVGLANNRKAVVKADMIQLHNLILRMTTIGGNWFGLVTPDCYSDLLGISEFVDYDKTGNSTRLALGYVGKIMGIEIGVRATEEAHTGLIYSSAATPVKRGTEDALVNTDRPANLFWNDKMVCSAEGKARTIINTDAPGYLGGTIIESYVRFGADIIRPDQKGVVALLEDNV